MSTIVAIHGWSICLDQDKNIDNLSRKDNQFLPCFIPYGNFNYTFNLYDKLFFDRQLTLFTKKAKHSINIVLFSTHTQKKKSPTSVTKSTVLCRSMLRRWSKPSELTIQLSHVKSE